MRYKAIISFSGIVSMAMGDVSEITDTSIANDLLKAGYIIPLDEQSETKKAEKSKSTRKGKKDGN